MVKCKIRLDKGIEMSDPYAPYMIKLNIINTRNLVLRLRFFQNVRDSD